MDPQGRQTPPPARDRADEKTPSRQGDILGLSDADPAVPLPGQDNITNRGGSSGLTDEPVRTQTTAFRQSKGATGIDMGAGGTGTDVAPTTPPRPDSTE